MALCSGVDGQQRAGARERHHEVAAADDGLLVGVREGLSRLEAANPAWMPAKPTRALTTTSTLGKAGKPREGVSANGELAAVRARRGRRRARARLVGNGNVPHWPNSLAASTRRAVEFTESATTRTRSGDGGRRRASGCRSIRSTRGPATRTGAVRAERRQVSSQDASKSEEEVRRHAAERASSRCGRACRRGRGMRLPSP